MFSRFTAAARKVMQRAFREAKRCEHDFVGTEHLLFGALYDPEGPAVTLLRSLHGNPELILEKVELSLQRHDGGMAMEQFPLSPASKRVFRAAADEAAQFNHQMIGPEHLLLGVLREHECEAALLLSENGVTMPAVRDAVARIPPDAYHDAQIRSGDGSRAAPSDNPSVDELEAWIAPAIQKDDLPLSFLPLPVRMVDPLGVEKQLRRTQLFLGAFGAYVLGHWTTGYWQVGVILAGAGALLAYINRSWVSIPVCGLAALLAAEGHRRHGGFPPPLNPGHYTIALSLGLLFGSFLCDFWRFKWIATKRPADDEPAVAPSSQRVAADTPLPTGAAVFLHAQGRWWRGVVVGEDAGLVRIRYPGADGNWEESLPREELRLPPTD